MSRSSIRDNLHQVMFVLIAFFAMVVVGYIYVREIVRVQLKANGDELMVTANSIIHSRLSESEIYLTNAVFSAAYIIESGGSQKDVLDLLSSQADWLNKTNDSITAFNGIYGYIRDEYLDGIGWLPPEDYVPVQRPWYAGAVAADGAVFYTEPYTDAHTGRTVFSVSQAVIGRDGERYGVVAVDVDITALAEYVNKLNVMNAGYGVLLNTNLEIVAHADPSLIGARFDSVNEGYEYIASLLNKRSGVSAVEMTDYDGTFSVAFLSRMFNGWYIGVVTPRSIYYDKLYEMAIILSVLGVVLSSVLCFFLIRIYDAKLLSDERSESKSSFLAKMSHEIRTPMNAIVGMSELVLMEREFLPRKAYEHVLGIKQAAANLLSIINDILDFSKIESGKMEIVSAWYSLASIVNDVVNIIRMRIKDKAVVFTVNIDSCIPNRMMGDEVRIRQIILNLLSNAAKYTSVGHISLYLRGDFVAEGSIILTVEVEDTGIGIKEEDMPKLFGDFVQIDLNKNKGIEGTGLGLPITKNLSIAMGGDATVSSAYGEGSVFTVTIPQKYVDPTRFATVRNAASKKVLLYETREVYAVSISGSLDNLGVRHRVVGGQSAFLEALRREQFDCIFASTFVYETVRTALDVLNIECEVVALAEIGELVADLGARTIVMPAHSLSIANALNHEADERYTRDDSETGVRFTAPGARVLVVDDIETNLRVAKGLMAPYELTVDTCISGAESIEMIRANRYDVVFMDHMMPDMDGIETTERIRRIQGEYFRKLPIVALTANAVSGMREMFLEKGLNDFLPKPIDTSKLNVMLEKWIPQEKQVKCALETFRKPTGGDASGISIEGIDVEEGLSHIVGGVGEYMSILSIFREEGFERMELIRDAYAKCDFKRYTTYVHAIKSASATIGAAELSDAARRLEEAGRDENLTVMRDGTEKFLEDYAALLENIGCATERWRPEPVEPDAEYDEDLLWSRLLSLREALEKFDVGAINAIMSSLEGTACPEGIADRIAEISHGILVFEYEAALSTIDEMLESR